MTEEHKPIFDIDRRKQEAAEREQPKLEIVPPPTEHAPLTIEEPEPPKEDSIIIRPPEVPLSTDEIKEIAHEAKERGKKAAADMGENFLIPLREGIRSIFQAVFSGLDSAGSEVGKKKKDGQK